MLHQVSLSDYLVRSILMSVPHSEYSWYTNFNNLMSSAGLTAQEIGYVKIWSSDYPKVRLLHSLPMSPAQPEAGIPHLRIVDSSSDKVRYPE